MSARTEVPSFAPETFGSFAKRTLFVASEGSGNTRAITSGGVKTDAIPGNRRSRSGEFRDPQFGQQRKSSPRPLLVRSAYPNNVQSAVASRFAPYPGNAIVPGEPGHGVFDIHDKRSSFVTTRIEVFPAQPEDGLFVNADIVR